MIKRVIGIVVSLAIVALIVFTVLGAGSYKSMLPESLFQSKESVEEVTEEVAEEVADGVAGEVTEIVESADSVVVDGSVENTATEEMSDGAEPASEDNEQSVDVE